MRVRSAGLIALISVSALTLAACGGSASGSEDTASVASAKEVAAMRAAELDGEEG